MDAADASAEWPPGQLLAALLELAEVQPEAVLPAGPTSRLFAGRHYPAIARALSGGAGRALLDHMRVVVASDRVLPKLELTHPGEQIYFGNDAEDSDRSPVYALTGQTREGLKATLKECKVVDPSWVLANNPFNWLMVMVMKWALEARPEGDQRLALLFFVIHVYSSLVFKYFRRNYQPNAMSFAVNSLSDKFVLKQAGTMLTALMTVAWRSHEKYSPNLRAGDDKSLFMYYVNLWTRLNGMVKGLAGHYYEVLSKGQYLNQGKDRHDDGELAERDPESGRAEQVADRASEAFATEPTDQRLLGLASQMADAPRQSVMLALNELRATEAERVREIDGLLLELFFEEKRARPEDVRTRAFVAFGVAVYMRSNTKDNRVEKVKAILDELLTRHSEAYRRTNRDATRGVLRKAIYLYLVLQAQSRA